MCFFCCQVKYISDNVNRQRTENCEKITQCAELISEERHNIFAVFACWVIFPICLIFFFEKNIKSFITAGSVVSGKRKSDLIG